MCPIILQSAACCAALPFGTLCYKRHEFRGDLLNVKCVPNLSKSFFLKHFSFSVRYYPKSKQILMEITCFLLRIYSYLNL